MVSVRPPTLLRMESRLYRQIVEHLTAAKPAEGVGLLGGLTHGGERRATRFFPGTNLDRSPTRYTMDPAEVIIAFGEMEARGWDLVAVVHSHPTTAPTPSATDRREAHYPEALLLILGMAASPPVTRCWSLTSPMAHGGKAAIVFREVRVIVDDGEPIDRRGAGRKDGTQ